MGIGQILAWSTTYYLPAVLARPIARDTGWSVAGVVAGLSCGLLVAGVCSPLVGRQIDRRGGRPILAGSSVLMAVGLSCMGLAEHLAIYYLAWVCIGMAMAAGLYDAAFATLGRLLGDNARASMTGLTLLGGFASTLGWPLIAGLEHEMGWRHACFTLAAGHLMIGLPIHALLVPREAEVLPGTGAGAAKLAGPVQQSAALNRLFLTVAALLTVQSLVLSTISVHLLTLLKQLGIATATALAIGMLIGPSQVAARLANFTAAGRLHPAWSTRLGVLLCGLGVAFLIPAQPWLAFAAMALYGAGNGILTIARGALPLELFGADGFGARMGLLARPMLIAQALGPVAAATLLTRFGAQTLLLLLCGLATLSLLLSCRLPTGTSAR
ncbi:MFS transporter [Pseudomonas benzenivorans]|uniref:MFS transporter n=1 Tax=Pseudomonas benzenivorans TaxID=556533 RepID=A0ABY5HDJ2_9PSED|nr:MFS transporter [Pseudomonas benzenivorans]